MATWHDVERLAAELPETSLGEAHEGSPAVTVGDVQFARLRSPDDGREVLQFWVPERELVAAYVEEDPRAFRAAQGTRPCRLQQRQGHDCVADDQATATRDDRNSAFR